MTNTLCGHQPPTDDCDFCRAAEHEPEPKPRFKTETFDAPAIWASALVNGDESGLDYYGPACVAEFEAWVKQNPGVNVVDCSDEPFIGRWNGVQTELLTYTTLQSVE